MGDNSTNCNRFDPRFMDIGYGHFDYTMGNSDKKKDEFHLYKDTSTQNRLL